MSDVDATHWHYPVASHVMTEYGYEWDVDWEVAPTRHEAVTAFGRDDPDYICVCYDIACLDDCDWFWTPDPVWRRND